MFEEAGQSPSLSILRIVEQRRSGWVGSAVSPAFISTQLYGKWTTKSNSNELPFSSLFFHFAKIFLSKII